VELDPGAPLGAQLEGPDSRLGHGRHRRGHRGLTQGIGVGDGVDRPKPAAIELCLHFRSLRNRSMKRVDRLPATKSGSRRVRLWRGIEVWIPSTTKKSRARCMRAIASLRLRSWTMSLPTSES